MILDEFNRINADIEALIENLGKRLGSLLEKQKKRKKVILAASYLELEKAERILKRQYAKHRLSKPMPKKTYRKSFRQPRRVHALPRSFSDSLLYRLVERKGIDIKLIRSRIPRIRHLPFAFSKIVVPREVVNSFKYSKVDISRFYSTYRNIFPYAREFFYSVYIYTGGFPSLLTSFNSYKPRDNFPSYEEYEKAVYELEDNSKYIVEELEARADLSEISNSLLGDKIIDDLRNSYVVYPLYILEERDVQKEYTRAHLKKFVPMPIDPGAIIALARYLRKEEAIRSNIKGKIIESTVLITLLYLTGYTDPKRNDPRVFRIKGADFIAKVKVDETPSGVPIYAPIIVEAKAKDLTEADLISGSKFMKSLRKLALLGYEYATYPILVVNSYPSSYKFVYVRIEPDESIRKKHNRNRSVAYKLGDSPYYDSNVRPIRLMTPREFSLAVPMQKLYFSS